MTRLNCLQAWICTRLVLYHYVITWHLTWICLLQLMHFLPLTKTVLMLMVITQCKIMWCDLHVCFCRSKKQITLDDYKMNMNISVNAILVRNHYVHCLSCKAFALPLQLKIVKAFHENCHFHSIKIKVEVHTIKITTTMMTMIIKWIKIIQEKINKCKVEIINYKMKCKLQIALS